MTDSTSSAVADRVDAIVARYRVDVVREMRGALDLPGVQYADLIRYHLGWQDEHGQPTDARSGKMLRPVLCLLSCEAAGGDPRQALPAAAAIELVHNFSLIHDDIEDESPKRHGRQTLWARWGIAQAINTGDGLFAIAQRAMLRLRDVGVAADDVIEALLRLNNACVDLCQGQMSDLAFESRTSITMPEYEAMIRGKSAVLVQAAAAIGALVARGRHGVADAFGRYGLALGLGFQIQDDVLGIWGSPNRTGKPVGDDIRARKKSYPIVYAMEHLDADGKAVMARVFGAGEVTDSGVQQVMELLDRCGAREAASTAARNHVREAGVALNNVEMTAERRADLVAIATFAVEREA